MVIFGYPGCALILPAHTATAALPDLSPPTRVMPFVPVAARKTTDGLFCYDVVSTLIPSDRPLRKPGQTDPQVCKESYRGSSTRVPIIRGDTSVGLVLVLRHKIVITPPLATVLLS